MEALLNRYTVANARIEGLVKDLHMSKQKISALTHDEC